MTNRAGRSRLELMTRDLPFWRNVKWRKALQVDVDHAETEGRAAGTGLITGELVHKAAVADERCPRCRGIGEPTVVDLVASTVKRRCKRCGHTWSSFEPTEATES